MYCRCGNEKFLAHGLCSTCYTVKRQDAEYFGGLREAVLQRDGYRCRVCGASGRRKRSIVVHHHVPGRSELNLMISLCPGCHAKVGRTHASQGIRPTRLLREPSILQCCTNSSPPSPIRILPEGYSMRCSLVAARDHPRGCQGGYLSRFRAVFAGQWGEYLRGWRYECQG